MGAQLLKKHRQLSLQKNLLEKELIEEIESKAALSTDTDTSPYNTSLWGLKPGESWVDGVMSELPGAYSMSLKDPQKQDYFVQFFCQKGVTLTLSLDQTVAGVVETSVDTLECEEKMTREPVDIGSSETALANLNIETAGGGKWSFMLGSAKSNQTSG